MADPCQSSGSHRAKRIATGDRHNLPRRRLPHIVLKLSAHRLQASPAWRQLPSFARESKARRICRSTTALFGG